MATKEQLAKAREKAIESPNHGKRGKGRKTIALENARNEWAKEQLKGWDKLTAIQRREALKPENFAERKYVMDQMMGKAKEKLEVSEPEVQPLPVAITEAIKKTYGNDDTPG